MNATNIVIKPHHKLGYIQSHPECGRHTNRGSEPEIWVESGVLLLCIFLSALGVGKPRELSQVALTERKQSCVVGVVHHESDGG